MPSFLAGCSWELAPGDCHADLGLPCSTDFGEEKCAAGMAYQGVRSIPKDWDDWRHMVQGAVGMAVKTFGARDLLCIHAPKLLINSSRRVFDRVVVRDHRVPWQEFPRSRSGAS